jgi:hypothetical protein
MVIMTRRWYFISAAARFDSDWKRLRCPSFTATCTQPRPRHAPVKRAATKRWASIARFAHLRLGLPRLGRRLVVFALQVRHLLLHQAVGLLELLVLLHQPRRGRAIDHPSARRLGGGGGLLCRGQRDASL